MHEKLLLAESLRDTFKTISILPNKGIYFDDFTYIKGLLFAYDNFSGEIDQFDQNFKFIKSYNYLSHSLGSFTNIYYDCDSFNTFCFGSKKDIKTLNDKPWDLGIYQFRFDLQNGILLDSMCYTPAFDTNVVGWAGNLTSKYEYLGSDPECDLLLDLDRNNSSGLYPYDFDIPFALCAPNDSATLCDDDLYLHTSFPLDSISILLSNALNLPLNSLLPQVSHRDFLCLGVQILPGLCPDHPHPMQNTPWRLNHSDMSTMLPSEFLVPDRSPFRVTIP
ncbi:MAG: hypothetical protein IPN15_18835 [Saprospiraceae bacterium]|nr:hypothetical protein [Candidatus Vicinibacter affinis]